MVADFITSAQLADYIGLEGEADLFSGLADLAIAGACQVVSTWLGQPLDGVTQADVWVDGSGTPKLFLPAFPVTVTALTVWLWRGSDTSYTLAGDVDYVVDGERGIVTLLPSGQLSRFPFGYQNVQVSFSSGAGVPADVVLVALQAAARAYEQGGVMSESLGGVTTTYLAGGVSLTAAEKDALRPYRVLGA